MEAVILAIELIGTFAFAVSGATAAVKARLDIFGTIVLGATTAVGGGVMRDVLLGITPPVMFIKPIYVLIAFITSLAVFLLEYFHAATRPMRSVLYIRVINYFDAVGLSVFIISGCNSAISVGYFDNAFLVLFLGTLTGIGGGMLRDILICKIPNVLRKKVYAIAALAGAAVYYIMLYIGSDEIASMICGMAVVFLLRMFAFHFEWDLPRIPEDDKSV